LGDNPLQRDLAKKREKAYPDRYLRPFFEKSVIHEYSELGIIARRELSEIPEQFRQDVYRLAQRKAMLKRQKRILSSDIAESAREYIWQQLRYK
jgi:hypothetical protein